MNTSLSLFLFITLNISHVISQQNLNTPTGSNGYVSVAEFMSRNRRFASKTNPSVFEATRNGQTPSAYFIGCSDSRVPLTKIFRSGIGEIFESRNIANQFNPNNSESVSALGYAVKVLNVPQVVVVGHEGCGGCAYALEHAMLESEGRSKPVSTDWTSELNTFTDPIKLLAQGRVLQRGGKFQHHDQRKSLDFAEVTMTPNEQQLSSLIEVNVQSQVRKIAESQIVRSAWAEGKQLSLHGLVYNVNNGQVRSVVSWTGNNS
ncbi:carbonic anhydrase [Phakopsora pachyrhizi]|uniref:Carbonic anhydrase n=1 Tax=Phakopsora pachyrhizi TaxID=170000 RepID=A0AAV0BS65_PHAPC|nr:carbonic anhydrase [Phakopsora pachyrhizi]CAH7688926.1 carbonic anhydrase [Phakopsora pachyrhizi]